MDRLDLTAEQKKVLRATAQGLFAEMLDRQSDLEDKRVRVVRIVVLEASYARMMEQMGRSLADGRHVIGGATGLLTIDVMTTDYEEACE